MVASEAAAREAARVCAASFRVPRECSPPSGTGGNTEREREAARALATPPWAPRTYPSSLSGRLAWTRGWGFRRDAPTRINTLSPHPLLRATHPLRTPMNFGERETSLIGIINRSNFKMYTWMCRRPSFYFLIF